MLEPAPPPHAELLPPVFGKPWYWQRSGSATAAESTRGLAHVITEMREEIDKLEAENRELRGEPGLRPLGGEPGLRPLGGEPGLRPLGGAPSAAAVEEKTHVNLRRNASAPLLEGQYKENAIMTVRRYSMSSGLSGVILTEGRTDDRPPPPPSGSGWGRLHEQIQHGNGTLCNSAGGAMGKITNRRSLQEYVHQNRSKVKTVTFLLPVDDIYTNRPALAEHQEGPKITELLSITETDS
ncbi:hypothetical protein EYF80_033955 [Liparis tanakae]|uniref:Uncharacterized protein n=1 Tax=Liparis tanakae TaxID=230148 RepID=A0A4Z2GSM6_9TELE|nr:hypothetical protein EYF80_033955 [Liparis tanakae]